jgi:hypothetical protein
LTIIGIIWLQILNTLDRATNENLTYVVLLFVGWGLIAVTGIVLQKKFYVVWVFIEKNKHIQEIFRFGFQMTYRP